MTGLIWEGIVLDTRRINNLQVLCNTTVPSAPSLRVLKLAVKKGKRRQELTVLRHKQVESLPESDPVARPLVVGREARRVRRLGDLAVQHLLERVQALAAAVEVVHEMHLGGDVFREIGGKVVRCGVVVASADVGVDVLLASLRRVFKHGQFFEAAGWMAECSVGR